MKSTKLFLSLLFIALLLIAAGCNKEDNPLNNNNNNGGGNNNSNPLPTEFGTASPTHILALIRTSITQSGFTFSTGVGVANLNSQDKGNVMVSVNGSDYTFAKNTGSSGTNYFFPDPNNPSQMMTLPNGSQPAVFSVANYTLTQNTVSVPGEITLNAPAANSNVPRTSDLTVDWNISSAGAYNAIFISDQNGNYQFKQNLGNVSTAVFTAAELGQLSAGSAYIYAMSYNFVLTNNNEAVLIGEAVAVNQITLQ